MPGTDATPTPLEGLLARLELAGWTITPRQRQRLWQVLAGPARALRRDPAALKYLLAPVLAHSAAEQHRFYAIFDQYYAELLAEAAPATAPEPAWWWPWRRTWRRYRFYLLGALVLALLGWWTYPRLFPPVAPARLAIAWAPQPLVVGTTATFTAQYSGADSSAAATYRWALRRADSTLLTRGTGRQWRYPLAAVPEGGPYTLELWRRQGRDSQYARTTLPIRCAQPPVLGALVLPASWNPQTPLALQAPLRGDTTGLRYRWDFGDGTTSTQRNPRHRYATPGTYTLRLEVERPASPGSCQAAVSSTLNIGAEEVRLPQYALHRDLPSRRLTLGWLPWALLAALAVLVFYRFWQWGLTQRAPALAPPPPPLAPAAPDRPPYSIPFVAHPERIRTLAEQLQLAQALRRGYEEGTPEIDIPASVVQTIAQGGFPQLAQRARRRTVEYLFLVDEENEFSYQGRLLRHLVTVLSEQEIAAETFYYRQDPGQCWNAAHPAGLSLEQLGRSYPLHRLVLFGTADYLFDPQAGAAPLRPNLAAALRRWPQRLLLTPRPPAQWDAWTAQLYGLLPIFPADLAGHLAAAQYIEAGMDASELPLHFTDWQQRQLERRPPASALRRWRRAEDYAANLANTPQLYRLLQATALYPTPQWDLTLAIALALQVPLDLESLLQLAALPVLQEGRWPPALRRELLVDLDPAPAALARRAIVTELEAAAAAAAPGFANRSLQTNLALQHFALNPHAPATQQRVQALLDAGAFSPLQRADLGGIAAAALRPAAAPGRKATSKVSRPLPPTEETLRQFLGENTPAAAPPPPPPLFNRAFRRLALALLAFGALLALLFWAEGNRSLERWWQQRPVPPPLGPALLRAVNYIDSAEIYNNRAVALYRALDLSRAWPRAGDTLEQITRYLQQAQRADSSNLRVQLNLARWAYNRAAGNYQAWRRGQQPYAAARRAVLAAGEAWPSLLARPPAADTLAMLRAAWQHTRGLLAYANGEPATAYYDTLARAGFFDTTRVLPNLRSLLQREPARILDLLPGPSTAQELLVQVNTYTDPARDAGLRLRLRARLRGGRGSALLRWLRPVEQAAPPGLGGSALRLRSTLAAGATSSTDSLVAELLRPDGQVVVRRSLAYAKRWGTAATSQRGPQPLAVQVLRAADGLPLESAEVRARWLGPSTGAEPRRLRPDPAGWVALGAAPQPSAELSLEVNAPGYRAQTRRYTAKELAASQPSGQLPALRLVETVEVPALPGKPGGTNAVTATPKSSADFNLITIAGGTFTMGCTSEQGGDCLYDEKPAHQVTVGDFELGATEVTQAQWRAVMGSDPSSFKGCDQCPVEQVSWEDVQTFLQKLNAQTGGGYRLPTEAEWEYAARGGQQSRGYKYAGSNNLDAVAWYTSNSDSKTHPVGQKAPNELGLYDMSGNVWEWCQDWYGDYPNTAQRNPSGPGTGSRRVLRGGGWGETAGFCRVAYRGDNSPGYRLNDLGFRLAR